MCFRRSRIQIININLNILKIQNQTLDGELVPSDFFSVSEELSTGLHPLVVVQSLQPEDSVRPLGSRSGGSLPPRHVTLAPARTHVDHGYLQITTK